MQREYKPILRIVLAELVGWKIQKILVGELLGISSVVVPKVILNYYSEAIAIGGVNRKVSLLVVRDASG